MPRAEAGDRSPTPLHAVLAEARGAGFLGPGALEPQIRHAEGFAAAARGLAAERPETPRVLDLGSGGGLPGLVVAAAWHEVAMVLLDASRRRAAFLQRAVDLLELSGRVTVLQERAEVCGRQEGFRGSFDGVLARSFGRPAVVAECAAPLLKVGGWLLVSEPPPPDPATGSEGRARWPAEPLQRLGLEPTDVLCQEFEFQAFRQAAPCPDRFPRRNGVPAKKPLF
ncbi:MAG: RsmG family class I SAM-dependent methyltransferase [Acidimicrobiales bacterium]